MWFAIRDPFVLEEDMPHKVWRWSCSCDVGMGLPISIPCSGPDPCSHCGEPTVFSYWARDSIEKMHLYQRVHGLKPLGPHRRLADVVFRGLRETCVACGSTGFVGTEHWAECLYCEGTGGAWKADEEHLVAAYCLLLHRYPAAAAPGALSAVGIGLGAAPAGHDDG